MHGLRSLESHLKQQQPDWIESVHNALRDMYNYLSPDTLKYVEQLSIQHSVDLAAKINVNSYGIVSPLAEGTNDAIGFGLFPAVGLCINHSCAPNCVYSFALDGTMIYRVIRDVNVGEEITVSYIDLTLSTPIRRSILKEQRMFDCSCLRCVSYLSFVEQLDKNQTVSNSENTVLTHSDAEYDSLCCNICKGRLDITYI